MEVHGHYKASFKRTHKFSRPSFSLQVGLRGRTIELKEGTYQASDLKPLLDKNELLPPMVRQVQAQYFGLVCKIVGDNNVIHEVEILSTTNGRTRAFDDNGMETHSLTLTLQSVSEDLLWFLSHNTLNFEEAIKLRPGLAHDINAIRAVIKYGNPHDIRLASPDILSNKQLCFEIVTRDGKCLKYLDRKMQNDIEIVMKAVAQQGEAFIFASPCLQDNKEVVLTALKDIHNNNKLTTISKISDRLIQDFEVVLSVVRCSHEALKIVPEPLRSDRKIVLEAVSSSGLALCFAPTKYRNDLMIVKAAVESYPDSIMFASEKIRKSFFKPNFGLFV